MSCGVRVLLCLAIGGAAWGQDVGQIREQVPRLARWHDDARAKLLAMGVGVAGDGATRRE